MKLYYQLWVDAIVYEKTNHGHLRDWKLYTLVPISAMLGMNWGTILLWYKVATGTQLISLKVDLFPGKMIDSMLVGTLIYFLPFILLNYLLIFRNKKYEKLQNNFEYKKGKWYLSYVILSISLFLIPIVVAKYLI